MQPRHVGGQAAFAPATPGPERTSPASARIAWVDSARGIGIMLVVAGHAMGGLIDSPLGAGLGRFRQVFFAIYTFHMPLFFLLSGLLVAKRVEQGRARFAKGLLPSIVWPYFLWSTVQFSVIWAMGSLVNRPVGAWLPTILSLPWSTVSQFWFLYALFWMHVMALVVLPALGRQGLAVMGLALKLAVALVALPLTVKFVANNLVWYALGACLGPEGMERTIARRAAWVRAALLPLLAILAVGWALGMAMADAAFTEAASPQLANLALRLPVLPAALFGSAAVIGLASLAGITGGALAQLGQRTMPIFLLHVMFIAGARIVLVRAGLLSDPGVLLGVLVAAGLTGPLLVERLLRPLRFQVWLGF